MKDAIALWKEYVEMDEKTRPDYNAYFQENAPEYLAEMKRREEESERQTEINRQWEPNEADIAEYMRKNQQPMLDSFVYDHLESEDEKARLKVAVDAVREFVGIIEKGNGASMIILASSIDGDMDRTGYGCGKTTLARCAHFANSHHTWVRDYGKESWKMIPNGRFLEARELMALFDKEDYDPRYAFSGFGKLLVIDDVGREGALRWERRDPEQQLIEKQGRYYNVINHCYEKGISVLITSNLQSRELAAFLGGATWSRLLQMCPKRFRVNMTGIRDIRPLLADNDWF